jgi:hypothetical protein
METIKISIQIIIALSIYNVWIIRPKKSTIWRGGNAKSMSEEFETYGLPDWSMKLVGFLKISLATLLLAGIFASNLIVIGALGIAILMIGAIAMHIKIKDELKKSLPAFTFLVLSLLVIFL